MARAAKTPKKAATEPKPSPAKRPAPAKKAAAEKMPAAEKKAAAPKKPAPERRSAAEKRRAAKVKKELKVAELAAPHEDDAVPPDAIRVRRLHRRDLNRAWEFMKLVFRDVNRQTLEYQRPRNKQRFLEVYEEEGIEQLLFEVNGDIVGYAECAFEVTGSDNWINPRFFEQRDMRPLFVDELASHPEYQGRGVGSFMLEQLQHLARVRGCTHLVLEVAENNETALRFYRKRSFFKLDAAIFLAQKVDNEPELLPPRALQPTRDTEESGPTEARGEG